MSLDFSYILDKIKKATFNETPFKHLEIKNFLSDEHLELIINCSEIHFAEQQNVDQLYNTLIANGWCIQDFPGCTSNWNQYKKHLESNQKYKSNEPVENIGITFRLKKYNNHVIEKLLEFMNSDEFHQALKNKFEITAQTGIISAIQKNLSGYEISPHPDIREKCLTYLLNIQNNREIEKQDCHTHLLEFKEQYKNIAEFWQKNPTVNRCWVPWDWCITHKQMNENNSIVIFHPDNNPPTLHAVKLMYDHLKYQRTQIYGNLMYTNPPKYLPSNYKDFSDKL